MRGQSINLLFREKMITAAERRAKIEKLRRDREAKEKERLERLAQQKKEETMQTSSNRIID